MAKRLCDPTSGKIGNQVYQNSRNGQVVRTRAIPTNPNSAQQQLSRQALATYAAGWDTLTEAQRLAWIAAAADVQTKARLGMSGPLTGIQLYCKINASLAEVGGSPTVTVPAAPAFATLPISGLEIINTAGVNAISLLTTGSPSEACMLRAARPVKQGVYRCPEVVSIGTLTSPVGGKINISTAYKARFGEPLVGQKIFVQVNENLLGWQGQRSTYSATVPAAA